MISTVRAYAWSVRELTWDEVRARRLRRHHLATPAPRTRLVEVVREVGGIHAQVMSAAELALSARVRGLAKEHVDAALWHDRTLVKTWTLRGTLHIHAADELSLWLAARRAVVGDWYFANEVRPREAQQILAVLADALDGRCLTRDELVEAVTPKVSGWAREHIGSGWGTVLGPAALNGTLVHGPPRGTLVTFVRPDQWLAKQREWEPKEALAEVLRRYLGAFGPATHRDFAAWISGSQLKAKDAKELLDSIADELEAVDVEGRQAWLLGGREQRPVAVEGVRLIPEYDAYVMGFREREQLFSADAVARTTAHGKGRLEGPGALSWLLVDGEVAGTWSRKRTGAKLVLRVDPFRRLKAEHRRGVDAEVERIAALWDCAARLEIAR